MSKPDLSTAYANSVPDRQQRRLASLAETFAPNALYDRLLALQERDPAGYAATTTHSMRMAIGHYVEARAAATQLEQETNA